MQLEGFSQSVEWNLVHHIKLYHPHIQEVFHVYLNKFENAATHLFLVILGNN